jgi:glycosyltransferase involved in cell wall biosynthesis
MRVAVVHEFLYVFGGAERVLKAILDIFPDADLYCLFDRLDSAARQRIGIKDAKTTFLHKFPYIEKYHRLCLGLMPIAIEQLDLSQYDLVISSNASVAKGVITGPDQLHISYVHSPMRYAWDMQHNYLRDSNNHKGIRGIVARYLLHKMRIWDARTAHGPDYLIANSHYISRRIKKAYGRDSDVIYPPVRVPDNVQIASKENYFLAASRFVPYKNIHVIAEAFAKLLPNENLIISGDGADNKRIRSVIGTAKNVKMVGFVDDNRLADLQAKARAFVFAAEEDFGIVPVEAQARGTPVIALGRGGARETVITEGQDKTGVYFNSPTPEAIAEAIQTFVKNETQFSPMSCIRNAKRFSEERFSTELRNFIIQRIDLFEERAKIVHKPATAKAE